MSMISGIQGQFLEVTVVSGRRLKDTELITRQDPYVCLEYANHKTRTRTCTDGGKNPTFQEKFQISLIEGLHEMNVSVWNSNTFTSDTFIGDGRIQLQKVLLEGFDDNPCILQTKTGKWAGEVKLVMYFSNVLKNMQRQTSMSYIPTPMPPPMSPFQTYAPYPPKVYPHNTYPPPDNTYPSQRYPHNTYPPSHNTYLPQGYPHSTYPPLHTTYPPQGYPHNTYPPPHNTYLPQGYPHNTYPTQGYPHNTYPPHPHPYTTYPNQPQNHMHPYPSPQHQHAYYPPGPYM